MARAESKERNDEIVKDALAGVEIKALETKYGITNATVRGVIKRRLGDFYLKGGKVVLGEKPRDLGYEL